MQKRTSNIHICLPADRNRPLVAWLASNFLVSLAAGQAHKMSVIRGIYAAEEEEDPDFVEVKTFYDAAECKAWYEPRKRTTNPDHPQCEQIYTTLVDWDQAQSLLLNKIVQYRATMPHRPVSATLEDGELPSANVYKSCEPLLKELRDRLDLPFHRETNEESTLNTFRYCFNHMRYGIFVMIRNNKLVLFVPFVNRDYRNTWGDGLQLEGGGDVTDYALLKRSYMPHVKEDYLLDKRRWWANGNMICNVESPDYWGDAYLPQLKHMLQTLCKERIVPDCELFINKRDFPQLKVGFRKGADDGASGLCSLSSCFSFPRLSRSFLSFLVFALCSATSRSLTTSFTTAMASRWPGSDTRRTRRSLAFLSGKNSRTFPSSRPMTGRSPREGFSLPTLQSFVAKRTGSSTWSPGRSEQPPPSSAATVRASAPIPPRIRGCTSPSSATTTQPAALTARGTLWTACPFWTLA